MGEITHRDRPVVAIVGAGFAGLWAAKKLKDEDLDVVLIDRNNYHTFFPLLYQVAAAEIGPSEVAYPIRSMLRDMGSVSFKMGEVKYMDPGERWIQIDNERVDYDRLILAAGSVPNFFGVPGADEHAFTLRTMHDAIPLRHHILRCFEEASAIEDPHRRRELLTFSIVGAGATGVEYAGALAELIQGPLLRDYARIDRGLPRINLIESAARVLSGFDTQLGDFAQQRLEGRGVHLLLGTTVSQVHEDRLVLGEDGEIRGQTVVWTAGVKGPSVVNNWGLRTTRSDRLEVDSTLQLPGFPEIFAAGDLADLKQDGEPLPQVAPVAIQSGELAAENTVRSLKSKPLLDFHYRDPGILAVIGRWSAVGRVGKFRFTGLFAWIIWAVVHVLKLVGFRNRLLVLTNWAWNYFSWGRASRLILPSEEPAPGPREPVTR